MSKLFTLIFLILGLQIANAQPVIHIQSAKSTGTGFYISNWQTITAGHVCDKNFAMYYKDDYENVYVTKKVIVSKKYDLCYIEWDRPNINAVIFPAAKNPKRSQIVAGFGYPHGIFTSAVNVQSGYIKFKGRWVGQARLNMGPGASGSPILNQKHEVVGVLTMIRYNDKINLYETLFTLNKFLEDEVLGESK